MSDYIKLKLNSEQLEVIRDALVTRSVELDRRADDMADHVHDVDSAYWIAELVEAKRDQRYIDKLRVQIRQAINDSPDFDHDPNVLNDGFADKLKTAIEKGAK